MSSSSTFMVGLTSLMLLLGASIAHADAKPRLVVRFDERAIAFNRPLPHARSFSIEVQTPRAVEALKLRIWLQEDRRCAQGSAGAKVFDGTLVRDTPQVAVKGVKGAPQQAPRARRRFVVRLSPLRYASRYCVSVDNYQRWNGALETRLTKALAELPAFLAGASDANLENRVRGRLQRLWPDIDSYRLRSAGSTTSLIETVTHWVLARRNLRTAITATHRAKQALQIVRDAGADIASVDLAHAAGRAFTTIPAGIDLLLARWRRLARTAKADETSPLAVLKSETNEFSASVGRVRTMHCGQPNPAGQASAAAASPLAAFCRGLDVTVPLLTRLIAHGKTAVAAGLTRRRAMQALASQTNAELIVWRQAASGAFPYGAVAVVEGATAGSGIPYISADIGLLVPFFIERDGHLADVGLAAYVGVNVYLKPVDKDTPLSLDDGFFKRFALTFGFTVNDLKDADDTVEGVLFGKGILVGAGLRITDHVRLGGGIVVMRQRDRNPAIARKKLKIAPYANLSVDFDVASAFKRAFTKSSKVLP